MLGPLGIFQPYCGTKQLEAPLGGQEFYWAVHAAVNFVVAVISWLGSLLCVVAGAIVAA